MNNNFKKNDDIFSEKKVFENIMPNVKNNFMCNKATDNISKQNIQNIENNNIKENECDSFTSLNDDFNKKDSNENDNILNNFSIETLCINEIKSCEENDLFDDKKYTNKDVLISILRKNLELKIKDYNLVMDTLIRTKEECTQKSDNIKKLQLKHNELEREYFNLKKENEKINNEKNMNLGNFSFYKNEYKDIKYKLLRLEDKHNSMMEKNEQLNKEITNLKNEKCKLEIDKNNEIEKLKHENEKLKNKNDQLLNEHYNLLEKYLLNEKKIYKLEREKKEEISKFQEIIEKGEVMKRNSVENLNKVKDVLSKSLLKSEENVKKLLVVEKERDSLKIKNENFIKKNEELNVKIDNLKNALKSLEKNFRQIIEKNNAMFSVTHEFLHQNNSKIIVLRKNNEIKAICDSYNIDKNIFDDINHFSVLYIYEVIHSETQEGSNESSDYYNDNEDYIKIKKSKYKSLNYQLNEAQIKIINLSRSNENFEKCCAKVKSSLLSDELNIYKKHYFGDHEYLYNEKNYIENILQEKIEHVKFIEKKLEEKDMIIHKFKENIFKLKLEKETLIKVIYSLPNISSLAHVENNNKKYSLEKIVENIVKDYICNMKNSKIEELNEKTPSNISKKSILQKSNNEQTNEDIPPLLHSLNPFRCILENLGKAILNIESKQIEYFKKSDLLNFIDDYMITIDIFNRISAYNNLFKVEILLENEFSYILEKLNSNEENKTEIIIKELERNKKNYSDEDLFHYIEDKKILDKYKQFYHDHFVNINNIFNTIISFNLYNIENKYKIIYERYFNLFNLNFSNVEISFDLLLRRFNKILRLSKCYEHIIVENNKKISELNKNEMELYKTQKKLEYEMELMKKEKENLEKVITKNEEKINKFNEKYILLQNEFHEYKNKYTFIIEEFENLKKEKYNLEQEISQKEQRNIKLNEQNCEIIKNYEKEKDYLQSLLQETKESNNYLKEKLESILNNNEKLKYDYDIRLNNLNTMWSEEKENNKKNVFNINNLKIENNNLLLKIKELENTNNIIKGELNERIKQINVFRSNCSFTMKNMKNISKCFNPYSSNNYALNENDTEKNIEYEIRERKLQENIADLERENLKLKGEKEILITSVDTWKCFSVDSKEEISRLKKICNEQLEKHKEFLLINQSNEEKLKYINNLLTTEKDKYEKDLNETKSSLNMKIEKLNDNLKEKIHEIKVLQYDKETLLNKIRNFEKEKNDEDSLRKKEEEYISLLKNDKTNLQKELNDVLEKYNDELDKNKKLSNELDILISKHNEEMRLINEKLSNVKKDNAYLNDIFQKQINFSDNDLLKNRLDQLVHLNKDLESELQENEALNEKIKCENIELKEKLKIEKEKFIQQQKYIIELQTSITDKNMVGKNDEFINSLKANFESSRLELQKLLNKFEKANLNEEKYIMKIQIMESKLAKNENEKKKITEQLEDNNKNNLINFNKLKTNLDILTEENRILLLNKEEYERQIEELKRDNQFFNSTKNNDLNIIEKEKLQEQVSEYLDKLNEKDKEIINLNFQIKKLTNENLDMKNKINLGNENNDSNNDMENRRNNENISLEIYKYINENIDLTAELENKNELIDKCKEEIKQKNDEINKLNDQLLKLSKSCNRLNESIIIMEKHKVNMNNHIKEKDEIIEQLKNNYNNKLDDLLNDYSYKTNTFPMIEKAIEYSSDDILKMYKNIPTFDNVEINAKETVNNLYSLSLDKDKDDIIIIKCNILKLFKLGSCYLYIINRNLKEIKNFKNQVCCLEQSIESLNQLIDNLKDENNKNEQIKVNNLEEILKLKNSLRNNENSIKNLKDDLKKNEEINEINLKNIYKYKNFINHLVKQSTIFCKIFKNINAKKKIDPSILNQLNNMQKSFNFYIYDSSIEELKKKNNLNINNELSEEDLHNVKLFAENFNLKIEKGETDFFNKNETNDDEGISSFRNDIFKIDYESFSRVSNNEENNVQKKKYVTNENEFIQILLNEDEYMHDKEQNDFNQIDIQLCKGENKENEELNSYEIYKKNDFSPNQENNISNEKNDLNEGPNVFINENKVNTENNIFDVDNNTYTKGDKMLDEENNSYNKKKKDMNIEDKKIDQKYNLEKNLNDNNEGLKDYFIQNQLECKTNNETLQRYEENILENFYKNDELIQKKSKDNDKDILNVDVNIVNSSIHLANDNNNVMSNETNLRINNDDNIIDNGEHIVNNNDNLIDKNNEIISINNNLCEESNYYNIKESNEHQKKGMLNGDNDKKIDNKYLNENVTSTSHEKKNSYNVINTNEKHINDSEYNHNSKENEKNNNIILENFNKGKYASDVENFEGTNTIENSYNQNENEKNSKKNKIEIYENFNDTYIMQNNSNTNNNSYSSHVSEYNYDTYKKVYEENNRIEKKRKYYSDSEIVKLDFYSPTVGLSKKIKKIHNIYTDNEESENEFKNKNKENNENEDHNKEKNQGNNNNFKSLNYDKDVMTYEEQTVLNNIKGSNNYSNYYEERTNKDINENEEKMENYEVCESENNENESNKSCYIISSDEECEKNDYSKTSEDEEGEEEVEEDDDEVNERTQEDYEEDNTKEIEIEKEDENEEDNEEEMEEYGDNSKEAEADDEEDEEEEEEENGDGENEEDIEEEEYEEDNTKEVGENEVEEENEDEEYEDEENSKELDEEKESDENEDDEYEIKENDYEEQEENIIYNNQKMSNLDNTQNIFNINSNDAVDIDNKYNVNVNNDLPGYGNSNKKNNIINDFNFFIPSNKNIANENKSFNAKGENSDAISIVSSNEENEIFYENEKGNIEDTIEKNNLSNQENFNNKENPSELNFEE
ncbi:conserved Plasmodium protein, unknown function [Plasmodium relictum]|uniref:Uncharacterized protein n=1 Tax=Plasmodium relictum TaxID=85471 RepID=A0A1J1H4E4_PLARL|nr:conserved Plasmodium protein, unknown function [Plasmodium relictum]CRG99782.1 conserved Plasmodium protein, unknown function [Plasmodium relictum]